jgi:hypothetical protein
MKTKIAFLLIFIFIVFTSCTKKIKEENFYYWRTTYTLSDMESKALQDQQSKKIYIRLCDIEKNYSINAHPENVIQWKHQPDSSFEYIPTIFIKNDVFTARPDQQITEEYLERLAQNTFRLVRTTWAYKNLNLSEIQIDCDWNKSTKTFYFQYLKHLKNTAQLPISATIRLHQIKYQKETGIPPIDKGILMCYNMGNLKDINSNNSIFDLDIIDAYIPKSVDYEGIELSLALPLFNWHVIFRNDEFVGLSKLESKDFEYYFQQIDDNTYKCIHQPYSYTNIKKGDILRFEHATKGDLIESIKMLQSRIKTWNGEVIFFDLNDHSLRNYDNEILD